MIKKSFLSICFVLLFGFVLFLINGIVEKVIEKRLVKSKILTYPKVRLVDLDSVTYTNSFISNTCLIHFNSACEHCQYELREIKNNQNAFVNTQVILMSSENIPVIKRAAIDFKLNGSNNIHFVKIESELVFDSFGSLSLPHIFIYGKDGRLIKEYKGETKVEAILKYL